MPVVFSREQWWAVVVSSGQYSKMVETDSSYPRRNYMLSTAMTTIAIFLFDPSGRLTSGRSCVVTDAYVIDTLCKYDK